MKNFNKNDEKWILRTFISLCKRSTTADPNSNATPSTPAQTRMLESLAKQLEKIGVSNVKIHGGALLTARLPANSPELSVPIGLLAHVDTSPDAPSKKIEPIVHQNYDGGIIRLPHGEISPKQYPEILRFKGHTIITSSGDTLLGADDKAGVTAIMAALKFLYKHPKTPHNPLQIAFTCDEEIGRGADMFPNPDFDPPFAYTLDSAAIALLEYENFNAASANISILGRNTHPGYARGAMINALDIAQEVQAALPAEQKPQNTTERQGFYHLNTMNGTVENAQMHYIIRDFDQKTFLQKKNKLEKICNKLNEKYSQEFGVKPITLEITDSYANMRPLIPPHIIAHAKRAIRKAGYEPVVHPIRGGTDGARLTQLGIPTPNLSAGGMNFHSTHEYASLEAIGAAAETIIHLANYKK